MFIRNLTLKNFRSYHKQSFNFSSSTTLIVGPNASGKTNILEAIYFLATGKSFRAERDREAILWNRDVGNISAIVKKGSEEIFLEMFLTQGIVQGQKTPIKKYQVNGVGKRAIDFIGNLRAVLFWPEDLGLITRSPLVRREYLNSVLMQVDREYQGSLRSYERGLRQRNRLLKQIRDDKALRITSGQARSRLLFWDQLLIKNGQYLTKKRDEFITFINTKQWLEKDLPCRQAGKHEFCVEYDRSIISEARIKQYSEAEVQAAVTLVGPHRDDIIFKSQIPNPKSQKKRNLASFGSRGEQRLSVLWLKIAELSYIEKETGEKPILLLDDIFSELDEHHRDLVFLLIDKQQTIVTSADSQNFLKRYKKDMEVVELK